MNSVMLKNYEFAIAKSVSMSLRGSKAKIKSLSLKYRAVLILKNSLKVCLVAF